MITLDQRDGTLECTICCEKEGISLPEMKDEQTLRVRTAQMQEDHQTCEQFAHNPARAQAERHYSVQMRALLRGL